MGSRGKEKVVRGFEWTRRALIAALVAAGVLTGVGAGLAVAVSGDSGTVVAQKCPPEKEPYC